LIFYRKEEEAMVSIILFINERPVGYTVTLEKDLCCFTPVEHSNAEEQAPFFKITVKNNEWSFDPFFDWNLKEQIVKNLPFTFFSNKISTEMSAAS
jgi:hypothetical protein